jgi:rhodanese-related sulfurtransferase
MKARTFIMKKRVLIAVLCLMTLPFTACAGLSSQKSTPAASPKQEVKEETAKTGSSSTKTHLLGGISPEDALAYMKKTPNLVIVEVNTSEWKLKEGFTGALWIPHTEMAQRYEEIPKGRPVLIHCGGGIVSKDAYKVLQEKRPDIPELGYIAGAPLVHEYNEWVKSKK